MHTIKIEVEDIMYQNIVDIQAKIKEFLVDFTDDSSPAISTEEAKKRVAHAVERYSENPENFTPLDEDFWDDTEKRLLQRHGA